MSSGALPAGLTLNSTTGQIAGAPTTAGTANFTVVFLATSGLTDTQALSILVDPNTPPVISTTSLPNGTHAVAYSATLQTVGNRTGSWSISAGLLPAGLALNPATGVISGTPTHGGQLQLHRPVHRHRRTDRLADAVDHGGVVRSLLGALTLVLLATLGVAAPTHAEGLLPPLPTAPEGDVPGVNDWSCQPTAKRPSPVILVHGTIGDRRHLLEALSTRIMDEGFCVFSLDYGNRGLEEISRSAKQLKTFTQRVLRATGAKKVSMVGHSQGGMMPRYYIKFLGGAKYVDDLVGIAPSNHGTALTGAGGRTSSPT